MWIWLRQRKKFLFFFLFFFSYFSPKFFFPLLFSYFSLNLSLPLAAKWEGGWRSRDPKVTPLSGQILGKTCGKHNPGFLLSNFHRNSAVWLLQTRRSHIISRVYCPSRLLFWKCILFSLPNNFHFLPSQTPCGKELHHCTTQGKITPKLPFFFLFLFFITCWWIYKDHFTRHCRCF